MCHIYAPGCHECEPILANIFESIAIEHFDSDEQRCVVTNFGSRTPDVPGRIYRQWITGPQFLQGGKLPRMLSTVDLTAD